VAVWFITGAARGLGAAVAQAALADGHRVIAATRAGNAHDSTAHDRLMEVRLDVTRPGDPEEAVKRAVERWGRIDILVNNAGFGMLGPIEETADEEVRAVYEANVFGLLAVTRAALPVMRAQRSGRIINIGSMGGFAAFSATGVYASTKFAVEGITESLNAELKPLGITATVIEPGAFRTDFMDDSSMVVRRGRPIPDYERVHGIMADFLDGNHAQPGDPQKAAAAIVTIAQVENPPVRLPLGRDALARMDRKMEIVAEQLAQWRRLSAGTGYDS